MLPNLAFGKATAEIDLSAYAMQERLDLLGNGLHVYESLLNPSEFMHQSSFTNINGLTIGSVASTPIRVELKKVNTPMLLIPLSGFGSYQIADEKVLWHAGDKAVLLPSEAFTGESSMRTSLAIFINSDRLEATARGMLGVAGQDSRIFNLGRPREIELKFGHISFDKIFRQISHFIDEFSSQNEMLNLSGVDDVIYRTIVMMLNPNLIKVETMMTGSMEYRKSLVDRACQYVQANQDRTITLSELERVSGMSERNLQYAFKQRFQCSPMQWIRLQRLATARERLLNAVAGTTITAVSLLCGFNKASTFAYYYKLRFNEFPSITLARSLLR